jgi:pilus assembly protein CpaB
MKIKSVMLLAVAAGCGLVAMFGVQQTLSGRKVANPEENLTKVFVSAQEIPAGTMLNETMLKVEKWPKDAVPQGAITDVQQIHERSLIVKAFPGDLILEAKLGEQGRQGASVSIPKGMRVVTVPVNLTLAHSGLLQPGDRVDVMVTYKFDSGNRKLVQKTKTVLEYIQVFATDTRRDAEVGGTPEENAKGGVKNISLLVNQDQATMLTLAEKMGTLQLALRNSDDTEQGQTVAIDERTFDSEGVSRGSEGTDDLTARLPNRETTLKDFLDTSAQEPAAAPPPVVAAPPPPPEKNVWTITIFAKDVKREEQIELPAEPAEAATAAPAAEGDKQEVSQPAESSQQAARPV